jgi:Asp-tRNA(Asn)/Glu-tRNA(Gln) amidotransferase A subunit family amidase
MQGPDPEDPACAQRAPEPVQDAGIAGLRIAIAGGYFEQNAGPEAHEAVSLVARALGADVTVELPEAARARAAAYVISTVEGANLHLDRLRTRPQDFDPAVRDRLIAGAMTPGAYYVRAQRFRRWYREAVLRLFQDVDVILAPATPVSAPLIGQPTIEINGQAMPTRASIGVLTQPISFIGLPVAAVPVVRPGMPVGVQVIAAPWREDVALRVALDLERRGVSASR